MKKSSPKPILKTKKAKAKPLLIESPERALMLLKNYSHGYTLEQLKEVAQLCYDEQLAILEGLAKYNGKTYDSNKAKGICRVDIF